MSEEMKNNMQEINPEEMGEVAGGAAGGHWIVYTVVKGDSLNKIGKRYGVTVDDLGRLAARALARREAFILDAQHIASKPIPVEVYVKTIYERIRNRAKMRFSDLVDARTPSGVVVVTFLAVLELYKRGMIKVRQKKEFGDIEMAYIQGAPPLVLKDEDDALAVQMKGKAKDNVRRA